MTTATSLARRRVAANSIGERKTEKDDDRKRWNRNQTVKWLIGEQRVWENGWPSSQLELLLLNAL